MDFVDEFYADKDLSLLKKLTLVIPTYNRNYYLNRFLWYHAHFPFGEIIVADSSPEEIKVVNREIVAKIRETFGANVRYLEYEPETEKYGGDIYRKCGDAVQHVETKYSQFCADKEFEIPITQCRCIDYLETHMDYFFAEGANYLITMNEESEYRYTRWQSHGSLDYNGVLDRMEGTIINNVCPSLGIYNAKIHKEIYNNYNKYNIDDLRFGEAMVELQAIVMGKYNRFSDSILTCRDITQLIKKNIVDLSESSTLRYPKIWEYSEQDYQQKYSAFKSCIHDILLQKSTDNPDDISKFLDSYLPRYLHHRFYPHFNGHIISRLDYLHHKFQPHFNLYLHSRWEYLWNRLPVKMSNKIRAIFIPSKINGENIQFSADEEQIKIIERVLSDSIHKKVYQQ